MNMLVMAIPFLGPYFHSCEERRSLFSGCQFSLQVQEYHCWC